MKLSHVHAMKAYGGVDLQRHSLQTSALDGGFGTLPGAAALLPMKESWTRGSVGSEAHSARFEEHKNR